MAKRIEFVCTANNGKSPVALAVARNYVGKNENYALSSTGTMVDVITRSDGNQLSKYLNQFLSDAYERNILSTKEVENLEKNPRGILEKFLRNERTNRDRYLTGIGLEFVDYPNQTHAIEGGGIIACIGDSNLKRVREIYNCSDHSPRIINLMGEEYPDVSNQWVLTYDEFRDVARVVRENTIRLIELDK